jgi:hypothetical protein
MDELSRAIDQSFNGLLQEGRIHDALNLRLDGLETEARGFRTEIEAAKIGGAIVLAAGVSLSAIPLVTLLLSMGAIGYGLTLYKDFERTRKICPLPGVRKGVGQLFEALGRQDDDDEPEDPLADVAGCLEPDQAHEYQFLANCEPLIAACLANVPSDRRIIDYRRILRYARIRGVTSMPSLQAMKVAAATPVAADDTLTLPATQIQGDVPSSSSEFKPIAVPESIVVPDEEQAATHPPSQMPTQTAPTDSSFDWAKDLLHFPAVLVWGSQGSGKTSFAAWLLRQRIKAGHQARVFDPHASYGQWNGLKVIGAGMNFSACDIAMQDFISRVKSEYQARSKQPNYKPTRETTLVDEFTQWSANCSHSGEFFITALSDIRKIQKGVIFISHDRSLAGLGGAKGFSQARDNGLAELHLYSIVDPTTGEPRPAMKGKLKIPGKGAIEVEISQEMNGSMDFSDVLSIADAVPPPNMKATLEQLYQAGTNGTNFVPNSETVPNPGDDTDEPGTKLGTNGTTQPQGVEPFDQEAVTKFVSSLGTNETTLFAAILSGFKDGLSPSDIVKESLKLKRQYQEGKALSVYLVRKHGNFELMQHFRKWLDEGNAGDRN